MKATRFVAAGLWIGVFGLAACSKSGDADVATGKSGDANVAAGCAADKDCKGDRVCIAGQCTAPTAKAVETSPAPPQPPSAPSGLVASAPTPPPQPVATTPAPQPAAATGLPAPFVSSYDPSGPWTTRGVNHQGEEWRGGATISKEASGSHTVYTVVFTTSATEGTFSARGLGGDFSDGFHLVVAMPGQPLPPGTRLGTNLYKLGAEGTLSGFWVSTAGPGVGTEVCTGGSPSLTGSYACDGADLNGQNYRQQMVTSLDGPRFSVGDPARTQFVGVALRFGDWLGQAVGPVGGVVFNVTHLHFSGDTARGEYAPINRPGKTGTLELRRGAPPAPVATGGARPGGCVDCPQGERIQHGCEATPVCPGGYSCISGRVAGRGAFSDCVCDHNRCL